MGPLLVETAHAQHAQSLEPTTTKRRRRTSWAAFRFIASRRCRFSSSSSSATVPPPPPPAAPPPRALLAGCAWNAADGPRGTLPAACPPPPLAPPPLVDDVEREEEADDDAASAAVYACGASRRVPCVQSTGLAWYRSIITPSHFHAFCHNLPALMQATAPALTASSPPAPHARHHPPKRSRTAAATRGVARRSCWLPIGGDVGRCRSA